MTTTNEFADHAVSKVIISVKHNEEYVSIDTENAPYIALAKAERFLQILEEGKTHDIKLEYPRIGKYYTFKGEVEIVKATDSTAEIKLIIKSTPVEHIAEYTEKRRDNETNSRDNNTDNHIFNS